MPDFAYKTRADFLDAIRKKHPQYRNVEDTELYNGIVNKYPQYAQQIAENFEEIPSSPSDPDTLDQERDPFYLPDSWIGPKPTKPISEMSGYDEYKKLIDNRDDKRGFWEGIFDISKKDVPFIGGIFEANQIGNALATFKKLEKNLPVTDEELLHLNKWMEHSRRLENATWTGKAGDIARQAFAFWTEIGATVGLTLSVAEGPAGEIAAGSTVAARTGASGLRKSFLSTIAKKGASIGSKKLGKESGERFVGKIGKQATKEYLSAKGIKDIAKMSTLQRAGLRRYVNAQVLRKSRGAAIKNVDRLLTKKLLANKTTAKLARSTAGKAMIKTASAGSVAMADAGIKGVLLTAAQPDNVMASTARQRMRQYFLHGDENHRNAVMMGILDTVNENASEMMGWTFGKAMGKIIPKKYQKNLIYGLLFHRVAPKLDDPTVNGFVRWAKMSGVHGIAEEMYEERLAGFTNGLLGLDGDDKKGLRKAWDHMWPGLDQLKAEALAFAIPGMAMGSANYLSGTQAFGGVGWKNQAQNIRNLKARLDQTDNPEERVQLESELEASVDDLVERSKIEREQESSVGRFIRKKLRRVDAPVGSIDNILTRLDLEPVQRIIEKAENNGEDPSVAVREHLTNIVGSHLYTVQDAERKKAVQKQIKAGDITPLDLEFSTIWAVDVDKYDPIHALEGAVRVSNWETFKREKEEGFPDSVTIDSEAYQIASDAKNGIDSVKAHQKLFGIASFNEAKRSYDTVREIILHESEREDGIQFRMINGYRIVDKASAFESNSGYVASSSKEDKDSVRTGLIQAFNENGVVTISRTAGVSDFLEDYLESGLERLLGTKDISTDSGVMAVSESINRHLDELLDMETRKPKNKQDKQRLRTLRLIRDFGNSKKGRFEQLVKVYLSSRLGETEQGRSLWQELDLSDQQVEELDDIFNAAVGTDVMEMINNVREGNFARYPSQEKQPAQKAPAKKKTEPRPVQEERVPATKVPSKETEEEPAQEQADPLEGKPKHFIEGFKAATGEVNNLTPAGWKPYRDTNIKDRAWALREFGAPEEADDLEAGWEAGQKQKLEDFQKKKEAEKEAEPERNAENQAQKEKDQRNEFEEEAQRDGWLDLKPYDLPEHIDDEDFDESFSILLRQTLKDFDKTVIPKSIHQLEKGQDVVVALPHPMNSKEKRGIIIRREADRGGGKTFAVYDPMLGFKYTIAVPEKGNPVKLVREGYMKYVQHLDQLENKVMMLEGKIDEEGLILPGQEIDRSFEDTLSEVSYKDRPIKPAEKVKWLFGLYKSGKLDSKKVNAAFPEFRNSPEGLFRLYESYQRDEINVKDLTDPQLEVFNKFDAILRIDKTRVVSSRKLVPDQTFETYEKIRLVRFVKGKRGKKPVWVDRFIPTTQTKNVYKDPPFESVELIDYQYAIPDRETGALIAVNYTEAENFLEQFEPRELIGEASEEDFEKADRARWIIDTVDNGQLGEDYQVQWLHASGDYTNVHVNNPPSVVKLLADVSEVNMASETEGELEVEEFDAVNAENVSDARKLVLMDSIETVAEDMYTIRNVKDKPEHATTEPLPIKGLYLIGNTVLLNPTTRKQDKSAMYPVVMPDSKLAKYVVPVMNAGQFRIPYNEAIDPVGPQWATTAERIRMSDAVIVFAGPDALIENEMDIDQAGVATRHPSKVGFTAIPRPNVPGKEKRKAPYKASRSTKYIGYGEGSTGKYRGQAQKGGIPVNIEEYTADDVVFVSVNGTPSSSNLRKTHRLVKKALDAGATVLLDSKQYLEQSSYNRGERSLANRLLEEGYKRVPDPGLPALVSTWKSEQPTVESKPTLAEPTSSFEIVRLPFGRKVPEGVIDGHRYRGKNILNSKPGERGALGNPFKASDAGGGLSRKEATEKYREAFLNRVNTDQEFRKWVLSLRGRQVGYYKPTEQSIHLHAVQDWLESNSSEQIGSIQVTSPTKVPAKQDAIDTVPAVPQPPEATPLVGSLSRIIGYAIGGRFIKGTRANRKRIFNEIKANMDFPIKSTDDAYRPVLVVNYGIEQNDAEVSIREFLREHGAEKVAVVNFDQPGTLGGKWMGGMRNALNDAITSEEDTSHVDYIETTNQIDNKGVRYRRGLEEGDVVTEKPWLLDSTQTSKKGLEEHMAVPKRPEPPRPVPEWLQSYEEKQARQTRQEEKEALEQLRPDWNKNLEASYTHMMKERKDTAPVSKNQSLDVLVREYGSEIAYTTQRDAYTLGDFMTLINSFREMYSPDIADSFLTGWLIGLEARIEDETGDSVIATRPHLVGLKARIEDETGDSAIATRTHLDTVAPSFSLTWDNAVSTTTYRTIPLYERADVNAEWGPVVERLRKIDDIQEANERFNRIRWPNNDFGNQLRSKVGRLLSDTFDEQEAEIALQEYEKETGTPETSAPAPYQTEMSFSYVDIDNWVNPASPSALDGAPKLRQLVMQLNRDHRDVEHRARLKWQSIERRVGARRSRMPLMKETPEQERKRKRGDMLLKAITAKIEGLTQIPVEPGEAVGHQKYIPKVEEQTVEEAFVNYDMHTEGEMPTSEEVYQELKALHNEVREEINAEVAALGQEQWISYLENYIMHKFRVTTKRDKEALEQFLNKKREQTGRTEARSIPSYLEATRLGFTPITMNAAKLYADWVGDVNQVKTNKLLMSTGLGLKETDGAPVMVVVPSSSFEGKAAIPEDFLRHSIKDLADFLNEPIPDGTTIQQLTALKDKLEDEYGHEYKLVASNFSSLSEIYVRKGMAENYIDMVQGTGFENYTVNKLSAINAWMKYMAIAVPFTSLFHPFSLIESWIASSGLKDNPAVEGVKDVARLKMPQSIVELKKKAQEYKDNPEISGLWIRAGLMVDQSNPDIRGMGQIGRDIDSAVQWVRQNKSLPNREKIAQGMERFHEFKNWWDKWLWHDFHPLLKLSMAERIYARKLMEAEKSGTPVNETLLREDIADHINNSFGGQEWLRYPWATPKAKQASHLGMFAPDWCCPGDTRAITKTGYKYHHELTIGDEILGYDPGTDEMRWMPLQDKYERSDYKGTMVRVDNYNRSIMMTPDHKCWVVHDKTRRGNQMFAKDLSTHCLIPRVGQMKHPKQKLIDDRLVRIAGWMVTDGSYAYASWRTLKSGKRVRSQFGRICQNKPKGIRALNKLGLSFYKEPVEKGSHGKYKNNRPTHRYYVSTELIRSLHDAGIVDNNLTWEFLSKLTKSQLKLLYETMMLGDGTQQHRFCGKEKEVFNMTLLQLMLGRPTTFYQQEENCWRTRIISSKYISCANDALGSEHYEGTIWCPSVETGYWMAERNGLIFATGNTLSAANVSGITNLPIIRDILAYSPSKVARDEMLKQYWPAMALVVLAGIPNALQFGMYLASRPFGDPDDKPFTFLNEPGKRGHIDITPIVRHLGWVPGIGYEGGETGERRVYLRWGKQAYEVFDGWASDPADTLMGKSSQMFKMAFEQVTGSTTNGWDLPFKDQGLEGALTVEGSFFDSRAGHIARKFMPFVALNWLDEYPAAFFAPASRGASKWKSMHNMQDVIAAFADEKTFNSVHEMGKVENLQNLVGDIWAAAESNGYNGEEIYTRALSHVRTKYYSAFFDAINHKHLTPAHMKKAEQIAETIVRLNGNIDTVERSMKHRFRATGKVWSNEKLSDRVLEKLTVE